MLDHGQLGPEIQSISPATTRNSPPSAHSEATEPSSALVSKTREDEGSKGPSNSSPIDSDINDRTPTIFGHYLPNTLHSNESKSTDSSQHENACHSEDGWTASLDVKRDQESATRLRSPTNQLYSNPSLAAPSPSCTIPSDQQDPNKPQITISRSPPILINPKCSGYFVEPVILIFFHTLDPLITLSVDEMDVPFSICWRIIRKDYMSE